MNEKIVLTKDKPEELIRAKQLIDECKYDEADQLIKNFEERGRHTLHDIVLCHLLECELLHLRGLHENVVKLAEQTYKESLGLGKNLLSVDALIWKAWALIWLGQLDKIHDIIKQGEELLKNLTRELPADYKQREAYIAYLKGWDYFNVRDADRALKNFKHSISLQEEFGAKREIVLSLIGIVWVLVFLKVDFDSALKYVEQGIALANESGNKWCIGNCFGGMAVVPLVKGDLDRGIMLYEQGLTIFNGLNNKHMVARILNSLGEAYRQRGELDRALECIEQALALHEESGNLRYIANVHDFLIQILIERGDLERAQQYLYDLEQLNNQLKDKKLNSMYLLNKALILKKSSRIHNKAEAEGILKQLLEDEDSDFELILKALPNLCELLLIELRMTNDLKVLEEINPLITRLLDIAEKSNSYSILCETYLLQARLSLLSFDIKKAQRFLAQGQKIAEKYGLTLIARKISHEHDVLLKQVTIWENLKDSSSSLKERMEFAQLNEQIENMIQNRAVEVPELSDEEPVLLLIVTEGGRPIFSQSFIEDQSFEDHLFGGFFTAINSFINEKFSEGLDRAIFGEHTLLMNSVSPFYMCYVFKGQSYLAQKRISCFLDKIQNDEDIWQTFNNFNQVNKEIQFKDIPLLKPLIKEIFMDKTIPLNS
ncbi:MAG: tetratricopeptide repeat protein [Candidatus Hodarchaeota archaeon]